MNEMRQRIQVSKLDAAKRQLETAIRLYFSEGDPVSIHTLSAAAYNILRDLGKNVGSDPMMIKQMFLAYVIPGKEKLFMSKINEAENFFKHADKDHRATLKFDTSLPEFFILDAIGQYNKLTGEDTPLLKLFRGWFIASHPDLFDFPEHIAQRLHNVSPEAMKMGRSEYMRKILPEIMKISI
jgi:hypothetical protein